MIHPSTTLTAMATYDHIRPACLLKVSSVYQCVLHTARLQQVASKSGALETSKQAIVLPFLPCISYPFSSSLCTSACYCLLNKHHCSWKINAYMAASQRKTCKYRILHRRLSCKLNLYLVFSPVLDPLRRKAAKMGLKDWVWSHSLNLANM